MDAQELTRKPTEREMDQALDTIARHIEHYAHEYAQPFLYDADSVGRVLDQMRAVRDTFVRMRNQLPETQP